jgi:methionine biosynthesis protein MetW
MSERKDLELIAELVPHGSHVLDLGCGNGALLALLRDERGCTGYGVELDDAKLLECVQRGVNTIQRNLDEGLAIFADRAFDVVLQLDTLQNLRNTEQMLLETVRVGRIGIVSFPNFAHWPNRLSVLRGAHAGDEGAALPVVRHAQYPRRHAPGLRGAGAAQRTARARQLRAAERPGGAPLAQPVRQHGGLQVRTGLSRRGGRLDRAASVGTAAHAGRLTVPQAGGSIVPTGAPLLREARCAHHVRARGHEPPASGNGQGQYERGSHFSQRNRHTFRLRSTVCARAASAYEATTGGAVLPIDLPSREPRP